MRYAVAALVFVLPAAALAQGTGSLVPAEPLAGSDAALRGMVFAPYAHALAALAGWALLMMVLMGLSVRGTPRAKTESGHPVRDYADPFYRRSRAYLNAVETAGPFVAVTVAAILTGAPPFWVNLLASVFLVARIVMAIVHIRTENQPLRSACFAAGFFCVMGLAALALVGAFTA